MIDISKLDFHEASIVSFMKSNEEIEVAVENVTYKNEFKNAALTLYKVKKIETDANNSDTNFMLADDGEIIFLDLNKNTVNFVVEWNDYIKKLHFKNGYKIDFDSYSIILS